MMNWKRFGRKQTLPTFKDCLDILLEGLRKITKLLSQDSRSLGRDLNHGLPEYEVGVLTARSRRSVWFL
jgi:hypothetical protein